MVWGGSFPETTRKTSGATISPAIKARRPPNSRSVYGGKRRTAMPLTPAIRPVSPISITAERPMSAPPASQALGVKAVATLTLRDLQRSSYDFNKLIDGAAHAGHNP